MSKFTELSIAVIIPVFQQSQYLVEAVGSVLNQTLQAGAVIVNDGCPDPFSHDLGQALQASYPGQCVYVRQPNAGLAAARNSGVRCASQVWPGIKAIFFLDADNFLKPNSLAIQLKVLEETDDCGFVYSRLNRFGDDHKIWRVSNYTNLYRMLFENQCDAASLVRRSVFDDGIFFDESMRHGYEDWEFFIRVIRKGCFGLSAGDAGVMYRVKQHSMLRDSQAKHLTLVGDIHERHGALVTSRGLTEVEHRWAPRYLWLSPADQELDRRFTSPELDCDQISVDREYRPPIVLIAGRGCWQFLNGAGLLECILLAAQARLKEASVAFRFEMSADLLDMVEDGLPRGAPHVLAFYDASPDYEQAPLDRAKLLPRKTLNKTVNITVRTPQCYLENGPTPHRITQTELHSAFLRAWDTGVFRPSLKEAHFEIRQASTRSFSWEKNCVNFDTTPLVTGCETHICFVAPWMKLGGVDLCVVELADALRRARPEIRLHLITTQAGVESPRESVESFDYLYPIGELPWHVRTQLVATIAKSMDLVINTHSEVAYEALRLNSRSTVAHPRFRHLSYLHVIDQNKGQLTGYPYQAAKLENSIDGFAVISNNLRSFLVNEGVAPRKIFLAKNAAVVKPNSLAEALSIAAVKSTRTAPQDKLKLLFAGRADYQKGIARLQIMVERLLRVGLSFELSFVGQSVLRAENVSWPAKVVRILPATKDRKVLQRYYEEADLFVLLSRWEGVPLSLLDAMSYGCACISTDVGAVTELVKNNFNGLLVQDGPDETVGLAAANLVMQIARDGMCDLRRNAVMTAFSHSWDDTAGAFLKFLASQRNLSA